jgi:hypothetical protein
MGVSMSLTPINSRLYSEDWACAGVAAEVWLVVAAADVDEAAGAFGLLLQPATEADVTARAAVTRAIVFSETLIAPLHFLGCVGHRIIARSDAQATGRRLANRIPVRVIACPNRAVTPVFGGQSR